MATAAPSVANERFARLARLLIDEGTVVLKDVLENLLTANDDYCPNIRQKTCGPQCSLSLGRGKTFQDHKNFADILKKHIQTIDKLPQNVFNNQHRCTLFNRTGHLWTVKPTVTTDKLDISLLSVLLRNICGLKRSNDRVWNKPAPTDVSIEANITRIRNIRNTVYGHRSEAAVTQKEFEDYWDEITMIFLNLSNFHTQADYEYMKNLPFDVDLLHKYNRFLDMWFNEVSTYEEIKDEIALLKNDTSSILEGVRQLPTIADLEETKRMLERLDCDVQQRFEKQDEHFEELSEKIDQMQMEKQPESLRYLQTFSGAIKAIKDVNIVEQLLDKTKPVWQPFRQLDIGRRIVPQITKGLQEYYRSSLSQLIPIPWCPDVKLLMDDVYTTLTIVNDTEKMRDLLPPDIFEHLTEHNTPRCLIEGDAGSGKSTLCRKLAFDWACQNTENQDFKLLFLIEIRQMQETVKNSVFKILSAADLKCNYEEIWQYMENNPKNLLFILDGYDELDKPIDGLEELISGDSFRYASVVMTSRQGQPRDVLQHFQLRLLNKGFSTEQVLNFVQLFAKVSNVDANIVEKIIDLITSVETFGDICQTPINVIFVFIALEDKSDVEYTTHSRLYWDLVNCVMRRFCKKNDITNVDLICDLVLHDLGQIAYNGVIENCLIYSVDDLRVLLDNNCTSNLDEIGDNYFQNLLRIGFLQVFHGISKLRPQMLSQFMHKSLQEFFAAYYLSYNPDMLPYNEFLLRQPSICVFLCGVFSIHGNFQEHIANVISFLCESLGDWVTQDENQFYELPSIVKKCIAELDLAKDQTVFDRLACVLPKKLLCTGLGNNIVYSALSSANNTIKAISLSYFPLHECWQEIPDVPSLKQLLPKSSFHVIEMEICDQKCQTQNTDLDMETSLQLSAEFIKALAQNSSLETVTLRLLHHSHNRQDNICENTQKLSIFMNGLEQHQKIGVLFIGLIIQQANVDSLSKFIEHNKSAYHLDVELSENNNELDIKPIFNSLAENTTLKYLDMKCNFEFNEDIQDSVGCMIKQNCMLQKVCMNNTSNVPFITDDFIQILADAILESKNSSLAELVLLGKKTCNGDSANLLYDLASEKGMHVVLREV